MRVRLLEIVSQPLTEMTPFHIGLALPKGAAFPTRRAATAAGRGETDQVGHFLEERCVRGDYQIVQGLAVDEFGRGKIAATDTELREERAGVKDLL